MGGWPSTAVEMTAAADTGSPDMRGARVLGDDIDVVMEDCEVRRTALALTLTAATATAAVAVTACGTPSEADRVRAVAHAWHGALIAGDGERACALLTGGARDAAGADCRHKVGVTSRLLSPAERVALPRIRIQRVVFHGDQAFVFDGDVLLPAGIEPDDNDRPTVFRRVGGEWKIEDLG